MRNKRTSQIPYSEIKQIYLRHKEKIAARIREFRKCGKRGCERQLFIELAFCILTPQSNAHSCWKAVERLVRNNLLFEGTPPQIAAHLTGVRFHNNKSRNLSCARKRFPLFLNLLKSDVADFELRKWLAENMPGLGYKEASHYLRNIGRGTRLAILDRHILRTLSELGVIRKTPVSLGTKKYLELERKMKTFSEFVKIPLCHMDLVIWYKNKKEIFK